MIVVTPWSEACERYLMQCQEPRLDKAVRKMVEEQSKKERDKFVNKVYCQSYL